jgi:hypothetical protein
MQLAVDASSTGMVQLDYPSPGSVAMSFVRCSRGVPPPIEPIVLTHVDPSTDFRERFMHEEDDRTMVTAIDARGARLGRPVLVVLIVSTMAVIGIFALLYYGTYG